MTTSLWNGASEKVRMLLFERVTLNMLKNGSRKKKEENWLQF